MNLPTFRAAIALLLVALCPLQAADKDKDKSKDKDKDKDDDAGYEMLFDGSSTDKWRSYKGTEFPKKGWVIEGDALHHVAGAGGGDIVSKEKYGDFELRFQWKVGPGANSGVMYRVAETSGAAYETGPEYQVLDELKHPDGKEPKTSASALYALIAPKNSKKLLAPVGEWNKARIVVKGDQVEHWLNGEKVVKYEWGSAALKELIAGSKFKAWPGFAREATGHICLQDHGDDVWFRKIRIRKL